MSRDKTKRAEIHASVLGCLAILFWGSTIAFSRSLTESLGTLTAATCIFLLSGSTACVTLVCSSRTRRALARLPRAYWIGCGFLFVVYMVGLYLAIGLARGRQQVIEVGMINYLWPSLTLVFSLFVLGKRARWTLWPGMATAGAGVVLVMLPREAWTGTSFLANVCENAPAYGFAFIAAVSWALYSNVSRRWAGAHEGNGVPVFLLATGLVLGAVRMARPEASRWTWSVALELAYMAFFPTLLAYVFWDIAVRKGRIGFVASASYVTPLLSTLISCLYLGVPLDARLAFGALLVIAGALICSRSLVDAASSAGP